MGLAQKLSVEQNSAHLKAIISIQILFISITGILICIPTAFIIFKKLKNSSISTDLTILKIIILFDLFINFSLFTNYFLWYFPQNWLVYSNAWCRVQCILLTTPLLIGGYLISLLSVERYLLIVFNKTLGKLTYQLLAALCIIYPLSVTSYFAGTDLVVLSACGLYCTTTATGLPINFGLYSSSMLGIVSTLTTTWCYMGISIFQVKQLSKNSNNLNLPKAEAIREATSTILKSATILILYLLTHLGKTYVFVNEWITGQTRTIIADAITFNLLCYTGFIDVMLFLNFNQEVKAELGRFMLNLKNFRCF
ncbi:hypothetical protein CONCODRAFT_4957 [Conidiobolus coronatus NRRL 28638]|uniref:G-protein coupled receptors family 1 profile domain-containing protein n=1 Tax=Conidiobolus coronatus (strain ATCC 28846 / CBS 209.66 / NRRL 28638) TaxID=796925 RepID=A0A137PBA9_CONC2|nr:hypothetical protein CONCODRAFT_4957 [Conidiobolus coronatus NRRL 28638]|eukprot:KXN72212.1 hypothetical protein CONCODRAFT_4957 [Conidiobolus coronatus NRRL 28638]